jgi:hypothetical protein
MPLLQTEAEKLSQEVLERGVIEEIITRDDLFALMPFMPVANRAYSYVRENTITEAVFLDPYEVVPEGGATFTEVVTRLRAMGGDVDMDKFILATESNVNDQLTLQIAARAKGLGRAFRNALVNGDSAVNAKSFDGLRKLTPSAQTLFMGTNGGALTLGAIDELKDAVTNGADMLMMRKGTWRAVRALLRAQGGNSAETIMVENFGRPIPAIDGMPVIVNDYMLGDEVRGSANNTCSIYALRLNEADGFHGITAPNMAGVVLEDIGTVQNKDAVRYRVKWYVGTALKATHSIARLAGVTNI